MILSMCSVIGRKRREKEALNMLQVYLIIQQLLMRLKQTNSRVLQRGFNFIMEKALWCLREEGKWTPVVQKKPT